jgi:hypothetical protein
MRLLGLTLVVTLASMTLMVPVASADPVTTCPINGDLGAFHEGCQASGSQTSAFIAAHPDHTYKIRPVCELGGKGLCHKSMTCSVQGHDGTLYKVFEDGSTTPLAWRACLTDEEAAKLGGLTSAMVERAFKRLTWPASELVVQPPHGKTLVNFDTNFYTANTRPSTQTVTLLGQEVTIEATPTQYTWHFGADESDLTTTDPGAAYPDLRVTHRYLRVGSARPSVDTTYSGRYHVGSGAWQTIPDTLTVPGQTSALRILSATPHLVGY